MANTKKTNKCKKQNNNKRGEKNFRREESNHDQTTRTSSEYDNIKGNDISWWNKSSLYPLATSVQYNKMPGYLYDKRDLAPIRMYDQLTILDGQFASFPSVMAIKYVPTLGRSIDGTSPVNLCFNSLFAELVAHTNSANVGFQQADLALMTLAIGSIINTIAECERVLGLTNVYFRENATFPKGITIATGFNWTELVDKKALYTIELQSIVQNFNALGIPSYIDLFKRAMQLGRNVYMDEDNVMAQAYCFVAEGTYQYDDTNMMLKYEPYAPGQHFLSDAISRLWGMVEALRNSSDLGNIMGALRRAFPSTATIQLDIPRTLDVTIPVYDRNVTWQVNNLTICDYPIVDLNVTQDPVNNVLLCNPGIQVPFKTADEIEHAFINGMQSQFLVNSYDGEIGPEFIMESSRMMFTLSSEYKLGTENSIIRFGAFGTEIPTKIVVYNNERSQYTDEQGHIIYAHEWKEHEISTRLGADTLDDRPQRTMYYLSKFRNHPMIHIYDVNGGSYCGTFGDLYTFTTISAQQLEYLHLAALQSIYLITTMGEKNI